MVVLSVHPATTEHWQQLPGQAEMLVHCFLYFCAFDQSSTGLLRWALQSSLQILMARFVNCLRLTMVEELLMSNCAIHDA